MSTDIAGVIESARARVEAAKSETTPAGGQRLELQRIAQQFEGMLLTQMLREMRKAGEWKADGGDGEQGMSLGAESFTDAIDAEIGLHLAKNRGIGLTSQLMQAFDRLTATGSSADTVMPNTSGVELPAPEARPVAGQSASGDGTFAFAAHVTSAFGWRQDPLTGRATFHKGVDLRAAYGQDVQAAAPGTVVFSGEQRGYGTTVVVEHADGSRSRYAHLSAATVTPGTAVTAGTSLGRAGRSGRATGTHLHFEVTGADGQPVSPGQWMQQRADAGQA